MSKLDPSGEIVPAREGRSWDDATPDEIRDARIQSLEEGLSHLKACVSDALRYGVVPANEMDDRTDAYVILDEEWSK